MTKKTITIAGFILFFGFAAMAQPALAVTCAKMMACMPTHLENHLPDANGNHSCTCAQATHQFINRGCATLKRNITDADTNSVNLFFHGLPLQYGEKQIVQGNRFASFRAFTDNGPYAHCPIFILNQCIIC